MFLDDEPTDVPASDADVTTPAADEAPAADDAEVAAPEAPAAE